VEALWPVGRKGIADSRSVGGVSLGTEADDLAEIIGGTGGSVRFQVAEIELRLGSDETPPQISQGPPPPIEASDWRIR
jgi:hypothetical protein